MKSDEKKCPSCAETIKLLASICHHCRHEFSQQDIASVVDTSERKRVRSAIDKLLKEISLVDRLADLQDLDLTRSEILTVAARANARPEEVEVRAQSLGMDVHELWSKETNAAVDAALLANQWNSASTCSEIADRLGVKWGQVYDRAKEVGMPFVDRGQQPSSIPGWLHLPRKSLILGGLLLAVVAAITLYSNAPELTASRTAPPSERHNWGMEAEAEAKYRKLSPEGKVYVKEQMRRYDELCASSPDC